MKVSILIPTFNAKKYIKQLLPRLIEQNLPENVTSEIIIIDSSSTDETKDIVISQYKDVKFITIPNKEFDHGGTRNKLAELSSGDYLLFMTQDAIPVNKDLISNLLSNFEDPEVKIAYARQIPNDDASGLERFARSFNYPNVRIIKDKNSIDKLGIKTFFNSNVCSMYSASLFKGGEFSGFPEKVILNEDMILSYQVIMAGYKVVYDNQAKVFHSHNYNLKQQFKRYFDIGMAFNQTSYILENVSNEKEGMRMVIQQQKYLLGQKLFGEAIYSYFEAGAKYIGYNLGKRHLLLNDKVKKRFSAYMK
jgi:rhamnosyltransferase